MTSSPVSAAPAGGPSTSGSAPEQGSKLAVLLVCLVSFVLYLPTLGHELVYDDWFLIDPGQNSSMEGIQDDFGVAVALWGQEYWEGVNPASDIEDTKVSVQALYRPLTLFLWATISHLYPYTNALDAMPYHLLNLLVNTWVVYLLFTVVVRLFGSTRLAVVASLLFAVHPLHSEAVAYVAGLSDLMATGAVFLGVLYWLKATEDPNRLRVGSYVGLLLCMFIGLLAKELAVLVLAVVFLTDLMLSLRGRVVAVGHRIATYGGLLAVLGVQLALRYQVLGFLKPKSDLITPLDNVLVNVDTNVRVANAFKIVAKYLWLVLWPKDLSVDYSKAAITVSEGFGSPGPLSGLILFAVILVVGLVKLKKAPAFGWGLLLFLGCATFVSNMFMPFGTIMGERLMYLPSAGLCLAAGVVLERLLRTPSGGGLNPVGLLLTVLVAGSLGMRTYTRNAEFKDPTTLFEAAKEVVPRSARVRFQLGTLYHNQGFYTKAVEELEMSLQNDPNFIRAAIQLGDVHASDLNWEKAIGTYTQVIAGMEAVGGMPEQRTALEAMLLNKRAEARRQSGDVAGAAEDLERAVSLNVEGAGSDLQLVRLLHGQNRYAESIPVIRNALAVNPDDVGLLMALCRAAAATQDDKTYKQTLRQLKDSGSEQGRAMALTMEGEVLYEQGFRTQDESKRSRAMELFEEAIDLDDTLAMPYVYRGRFMAERPQGQLYLPDAIIEYDRALERAPDNPAALTYKAMAQLALNLNEEALRTLAVLETINPGVGVWALQSQAYFQLGDLDKMEEVHAKLRAEDKQPLDMILNRATAYDEAREYDRALAILDQAFASPEYADVPGVWRASGLLQLKLGKYDEALASFTRQEALLSADPEAVLDPYLPVNKARALMGMDRDVEAAGLLEQFEAGLADIPDGTRGKPQLQAALLLHRADLFLRPGTVLYDPAQASDLSADGRALTGGQHPPFYDRGMEAALRQGQVDEALALAREAATNFFKLPRYEHAVKALEQAANGDAAGARAALEAVPDEDDSVDGTLDRLAAALG